MCEEGEENGTSLLTGTRSVKTPALKDPRMPLDNGNLEQSQKCYMVSGSLCLTSFNNV